MIDSILIYQSLIVKKYEGSKKSMKNLGLSIYEN